VEKSPSYFPTYFSTFPLLPLFHFFHFAYHLLSIGFAGSAVMFRIAQW
jgi:hypothetical protein